MRILVLPTGGAGGDLHPLLAVAAHLSRRDHEVVAFGGRDVTYAMSSVGAQLLVSPPVLDLGPRFIAARNEASSLPVDVQGRQVGSRLQDWGQDVAAAVRRVVADLSPDVLVSSLFGGLFASQVAESTGLPWVAINSTFYFGPRPDRRLEDDFATRTLILFRDFLLPPLAGAALVLHATDKHFDFDFDGLPPNQHYVGPLLWERPETSPDYLKEPGPPWVLVALSSDPQDDLYIASNALAALAPKPVRVLVTLGAGHERRELEPIPSNAIVVEHLAHGPILERAVLMVGHAGHGSVMKALWSGVPMVLVPWARDQQGVAARAERLEVAEVVSRKELPGEALGRAVAKLLADPQYHVRADTEAKRLRAQDPPSLSSELIERL